VASCPQGGAISGTVSGRNNLVDDSASSGGLSDGVDGNLVGVDALLGPLGSHGEPTQTVPPLPGSPAIDAGDAALAVDGQGRTLSTDQRGLARVVGTEVDIGAVESSSLMQIQGTEWDDMNGNGQRDGDEHALAGWTVYLDANQNGRLDPGELSTVTDAQG